MLVFGVLITDGPWVFYVINNKLKYPMCAAILDRERLSRKIVYCASGLSTVVKCNFYLQISHV